MAEANSQGRPKQKRKLKPRSAAWKHFTLSVEGIAQCKYCPSGLNGTHGTNSLWKHLVNHFTTRRTDEQGNEESIVRCNICQGEFEARDPTLWNHVKGCIEQDTAAASGASQPPPPVQSHAPSASGEEHDAAAAVGAASEPPPPVQSRAPSGSGASSTDAEPAGLDQDEASRDLARMIALGGYDPSVVEDDYFKSFVRRLNPGYEVPSRRAIEEMCDSVFGEAKEDFFSRLRDTDAEPSFSVGTTKTIEAGQVPYVACHFIDDQWNLHRMVTEAQVETALKFHYYGQPGFRTDSDCLNREFFKDKILSVLSEYFKASFMTAYETPSLEIPFSDFNTTYTDNVFHSIAQCFSSYLDSENMNAGFHIYEDVRSLHLTRQKREKLLSDRGLELVWVQDEQWYSWYCLLQVLHNEASSTSAEIDSEIRQVMLKIWGEIHRAIQSISASRSPTSNLYLIELFKVREVLYSEEAAHFTELADCLTKARETLDKDIKDSYKIWSIPLVLDPRYKLKHIKFLFENSFGSEAGKYISEATENIEETYKGCYGDFEESSKDGEEMDTDDSHEDMSELDRYLRDSLAPRKEGFDVLQWWKEYGSDLYPGVARMARDALAMPTCSKLSSEQTAQVRSIVRGYSKNCKTKDQPTCSKLSWQEIALVKLLCW